MRIPDYNKEVALLLLQLLLMLVLADLEGNIQLRRKFKGESRLQVTQGHPGIFLGVALVEAATVTGKLAVRIHGGEL